MSTTHTQISGWANEFVELNNEIATLKARQEVLREQLLMNVPAGTEFSGEGRRVVHSVYETTTLDQKSLKTGAPDVYASFCVTKESTRLTVR